MARDEVGVFVTNYEQVRALKYKQGTGRSKGTKRRKRVIDYNSHLAAMPWDFVICDEVTAINHTSSLQSAALHDFSDNENMNRIGLTGTIITDDPLNVFSVFKFIDPKLFGTSQRSFRHKYADFEIVDQYVKGRGGPRVIHKEVVSNYKNLDYLQKLISSKSIRWRKSECDLDLPEKLFKLVKVEWPKEHLATYHQLQKDLMTEVDGFIVSTKSASAVTSKIRQVCQGWLYLEEEPGKPREHRLIGGSKPPKLEAMMDIIHASADPLVVFFDFNADLGIIESELIAKDVSHVRITANENEDQRGEAVATFQRGHTKVCLCKTAIAKFGLTLTKATSAIYYSNDFGLEKRTQSMDRIHRYGSQSKSVTYYDLCMENSIDIAIREMCISKKNLADKISGEDLKDMMMGNVPKSTFGKVG